MTDRGDEAGELADSSRGLLYTACTYVSTQLHLQTDVRSETEKEDKDSHRISRRQR